jgi:hypothetical protein
VFTEDMAIEFFNFLREMDEDELVDLNVIPMANKMNALEE